jgi:endoglucanase
MDAMDTFLKELVEAHGAPGFEGDVSEIMARYLKGVGEISRDRLGSFVCEKKGAAGPKVMLAGHLDEVGFHGEERDQGGLRQVPAARRLVGPRRARPAPHHQDPQGRRDRRGGLEAARTSCATRTARRCSRSARCTSTSAPLRTGT